MQVMLMTAIFSGILAALADHQYKIATEANKISAKKSKKNMTTYYFFVFLCISVLGCVAGLRYYVGTDFGAYYFGYPRWEANFNILWQNWDEPGLATLAKILYPISQDGGFFIFVLAVLTISLFVINIAKNTDDFFFCVMLYIFTSCWSGCFNGVCQYLAAAILFAGHKFILERKFIKYCLIVFVAASFHITALVMLPIYFLITQVLDLKKIAFIIVSGIAMVFSYDFLFQLVGVITDDATGGADTSYAQREIHPLRIVIAFAPIVVYFFLLLQKKAFTGKENFYMGFVFVRAALIMGTANSAYLNRAGIYFEAFLPIALSLLIKKFPKNQQFMLKAIILILYFIVWIYIDASTVVWQWIWERDSAYYSPYIQLPFIY